MTEKSSPAKKARAKLMRRPIGCTICRVLVIDEHGVIAREPVGALVPSHPIDRRSLKERKFHVGQQVRAEVRLDRNPGFWRKAHVLGGWLADNVEDFHGLGMHDALKRLQEKSGVGVESEEFDLPGIGKITRTVAESLNFSDMDEGRFNELWSGADGEGGWIGWLRREVFGELDQAARAEIEELIQGPQQ